MTFHWHPFLSPLPLPKEQVRTKKGVNEKSSKTLQGTGWSKGFLNSTSPNKKNIHIPISTKPTKITLEDDQSKPSSSIKKVGFSAQNKIHEIPRIGERSFASLKQPERMESSVPTGPRPFETEIFSGIIHERPVGERFAGERSRPKAEGKKNLSKFALERLGERGWTWCEIRPIDVIENIQNGNRTMTVCLETDQVLGYHWRTLLQTELSRHAHDTMLYFFYPESCMPVLVFDDLH